MGPPNSEIADGNSQPRKLLALVAIIAVFAVAVVLIKSALPRSRVHEAETSASWRQTAKREPASDRVFPGEFERQDALLMSWPDEVTLELPGFDTKRLNDNARSTLLKIVEMVRENIEIVFVVKSSEARSRLNAALRKRNIPRKSVRIVEIPHDSVWIRDFAPIMVRTVNGPIWISNLRIKKEILNPRDHIFPHLLGRRLGIETADAPFYLDGGNLISNGRGLVVASSDVLRENEALGYSERDVTAHIKRHFGATEVVYLDPLVGEPTGHIDIFATFPTHDTIVLGKYAEDEDAANHSVLERNAGRLRDVKLDAGQLKLVRIPMAPRGADIFGGSYTNVIYANGVCLVPSYRSVDPKGLATAMATYRRLLPGWTVVNIDAVEWIVQQGALHCLTMNVYRLPPKSGAGQ